MNALEVNRLSFSYDGKSNIFEDISLTLAPGQVRCIVGPNGCGKTTLIDCILGLNRSASGQILLAHPKAGGSPQGQTGGGRPAPANPSERAGAPFGSPPDQTGDAFTMRDIRTMKEDQIAAHLAYIPQGHRTTFGFTVLDVVSMGRTYAQKMFSPPGEEEYRIARQALKQVGLEGFEDRDYTRLSGGELQLVIIARAIAQQAGILVMDEPTAHLDFRHEMQVMEIVAGLARDRGLSILMATHFLNQAYFLEDAGVDTRVSLMDRGRFLREGRPDQVLTEAALKEAFGIETQIVTGGGRKYILPVRTDLTRDADAGRI